MEIFMMMKIDLKNKKHKAHCTYYFYASVKLAVDFVIEGETPSQFETIKTRDIFRSIGQRATDCGSYIQPCILLRGPNEKL